MADSTICPQLRERVGHAQQRVLSRGRPAETIPFRESRAAKRDAAVRPPAPVSARHSSESSPKIVCRPSQEPWRSTTQAVDQFRDRRRPTSRSPISMALKTLGELFIINASTAPARAKQRNRSRARRFFCPKWRFGRCGGCHRAAPSVDLPIERLPRIRGNCSPNRGYRSEELALGSRFI